MSVALLVFVFGSSMSRFDTGAPRGAVETAGLATRVRCLDEVSGVRPR